VQTEETRLRSAGVEVLKVAEKMPWGLIESWVRDPPGWQRAAPRRGARRPSHPPPSVTIGRGAEFCRQFPSKDEDPETEGAGPWAW